MNNLFGFKETFIKKTFQQISIDFYIFSFCYPVYFILNVGSFQIQNTIG